MCEGTVFGTYLHGSLLPKNPHLTDHLLQLALRRRHADYALAPAPADEEMRAHQAMRERILREGGLMLQLLQRPAIVVHGGAGAARVEPDLYREALLRAAEAAYALLAGGAESVDAVVEAVRVMEDDPAFNAGYGGVLNARGDVECDAAVMRGGCRTSARSRRCAGCATRCCWRARCSTRRR